MKRPYLFSGVVILVLIACIALAIAISYFGVNVDYISLPYLTIDRVFISDKSVYAHAKLNYSYGMGGGFWDENEDVLFVSTDLGVTWQVAETVPAEAITYFHKPVKNQKILCYQTNNSTCYQIIKGKDRIQLSLNGGSSWRTDWKMPLGRKYYMNRHSDFPFRGVEPDTSPYDIALLESNAGNIVIVAMGNQGILIRNNEGTWDRVAVSTERPRSAPTPYHADSMDELMQNISQEGLIGSLFSFGYFIILTIYGWANLHRRLGEPFRYKAFIFYLPVIILSILCFYLMSLYNQNEIYFWILVKGEWINYQAEYIYSLPFIGLILTWGTFVVFTRKRVLGLAASSVPLLSSIVLSVSILLLWTLWALGIIPFYSIALVSSVVLGSLIVHNGIQFQTRINAKATESNIEKHVSDEVLS